MSCSQAILSVYGKYFGLSEELALKLASSFGGGMGHMGNTCGAVTGAFMVLGGLVYEINNPNTRNEIYNLIQEFTRRFLSEHESINCRDLLGYDISTQAAIMLRVFYLNRTVVLSQYLDYVLLYYNKSVYEYR